MSSKKTSFVALFFSVLFFLVLKYIIDLGVENIPRGMQPVIYVSLPVSGGLITLTFCSFAGDIFHAENSSIAYALRRVAEDPARNFLIGFITTAYLGLVRSPLVLNAPFLSYVEWAVIALTIYVLYTMTGFSSDEFNVSRRPHDWKKHEQQIRRETGRDLVRVASVMENFVKYGTKEPLLIYLTSHLHRLGETEEHILQILSPLIDYTEPARPSRLLSLLSTWRRGPSGKNQEARENLLNELIDKIEGL